MAGRSQRVTTAVGGPPPAVGAYFAANITLAKSSPMSRARWVWIFRDDPERLHTAMAFEQVAAEAAFVIGPVIAILAASVFGFTGVQRDA